MSTGTLLRLWGASPGQHRSGLAGRRRGFTLIELLVVVGILALISGVLMPVLIRAREAAKRAKEGAEISAPIQPRSNTSQPAVPAGQPPILDRVDLQMTLAPSYHRIGMDVYTRYRLDCTGQITFRSAGEGNSPVLLYVPFPNNTVEARDVQLRTVAPGSSAPQPVNNVVYDKTGIYWTAPVSIAQPQTAEVSFVAFGRDQFDYALPPARQFRSVKIALNLEGASAWTIPDEALQPSTTDTRPHGAGLRWEFQNLVSDRQITVQIPAAQAPLARMLVLVRLVALAVLLFGAGFWFLSEQVRPGQLDTFRWGHFLLLALSYSLFFVVFAVLEFHGTLGTPASMAVAAVFSLPLLVLHVSRVLDLRFAATRVVPLAAVTLGLVINGVYGGVYRDYVFMGAATLLMGYVTVGYQSWSAGRERYRQEKEVLYTARRRDLIERITNEFGAQIADLCAAEGRARALLAAAGPGTATDECSVERMRLERAREPVESLRKEYDDLLQRLRSLPPAPNWDTRELFHTIESMAASLRDRVEAHQAYLESELEAYRNAVRPEVQAEAGEVHCAACGAAVPDAPFCQQCGCVRPATLNCIGCGEHTVVPVHLLAEGGAIGTLFCTRCGTQVSHEERREEKAS